MEGKEKFALLVFVFLCVGVMIAGLAVRDSDFLRETSTSTPARSSTPSTQRTTLSSDAARVNVTFTSDPEDARLTIQGDTSNASRHMPTSVPWRANQVLRYTVIANEPYEDYDLYKPYAGTITPTEDATISVWLERTTAEEQEAQRQAAEEARRAEEERRRRLLAEVVPLEVDNWSWYERHGYAIVEGRVRNRSSSRLERLEATIEIFTEDGTYVSSGRSLLDYQVLLPGQASPFTIYVRWNPAMARASLGFREFWGDRIPHD